MELVTRYLQKRYKPKLSTIQWPYNLLKNPYQNDFWITKEHKCVYPYEMSDRHLINIIRLIHQYKPAISKFYHFRREDSHLKERK